jgi:hypothetical protein
MEQRHATTSAVIRTFGFGVPIRAGKGALSAGSAGDAKLIGRQLCLPLSIRFFDTVLGLNAITVSHVVFFLYLNAAKGLAIATEYPSN